MWLFFALVAVPLIEIALFIKVGGAIGLLPTLAIVLATGALGTWLIRSQGRVAMVSIQQSFRDMRDPTAPLAHGAMVVIAGALLVSPGFFTDTLGLLLLVPAVRNFLISRVMARTTVAATGWTTHRPAGQPDIIEGVYEEIDPDKAPKSRWTQH